ncbi:rhomboid family intramembrane serine protease [Conexibacter sp. W3-3-2]|uniref:Rhomboid family intramembrane serine protease n=1 Tax=Paraconexibacter algicola TaxID=2133960 RepID=A0A2T4UFB1_9ACTN|nr:MULTISPECIES: rhomboid family intramembrane serine protease [Solirubrobacterales]MTD46949.1 rhomboid family intramembrane serine protease [Conexibacter sp. W3-3-2]PTL56483.1 rhomboid family intramembrane serine protease [Paraconexibacter algicola]
MATSTSAQTCYRHPSRETRVSCSNCGRPICPDCMTSTPVGMRCPECSRDRTQVRTIQNVQAAVQLTPVLIAVCVIAGLASGSVGAGGAGNQLFERGALFGPLIALDHEYWRLITGGFLHSGLIHLGFNMYLLWMLGNLLEPALGQVRFGLLYFTSLLAGSAGALLVEPNAVTVGASGAVFGLMAAAFLELRQRGFDPMASGIGPLILLNLVITFVPGFNISIGGHIGGLIGGAIAITLIQQTSSKQRRPYGIAGLIVLCVVFAVVGVVAADAGLPPGVRG